MDWFRIRKGVYQTYHHPAYLTYAEYIMRYAGLDELKDGIKISRRNINNLRYADDTNLMADNGKELKNLLTKVKEQSEKAGLITSWQIDAEKVEIGTDFIFLDSKITVNSDYRHEIKRQLLLGRKAMTNLDSVLKSRDGTLRTKVCLVKAMVFPVVSMDVRVEP